jgi:hypothetical protein
VTRKGAIGTGERRSKPRQNSSCDIRCVQSTCSSCKKCRGCHHCLTKCLFWHERSCCVHTTTRAEVQALPRTITSCLLCLPRARVPSQRLLVCRDTMEFAAQVGAILGASALLYYVTKPPTVPYHIEEESDRDKLKGCFRYSHYHRQKSLQTTSFLKSVSTITDDTSLSSSVVSNTSGRSQ